MTKKEAQELPAQKLAFVGDAVHTLFVRKLMLSKQKGSVSALSRDCNGLCNAGAQEKAYFAFFENASEDEKAIALRGRNANLHHGAKNFSIETYRHATGFEAVVGYLFLTNQTERLNWLLNLCWESVK